MTAEEFNVACVRIRSEIPAAKFAEWREEFEDFYEGSDLPRIPQTIWDAGSWLKGKLLEQGADEELATLIVQATGQRQAMLEPGVDAWTPAVSALENHSRGEWELPGPELADKLIVERFGNPPNPKKMLAWLLSSQTGKSALDAALGIKYVQV